MSMNYYLEKKCPCCFDKKQVHLGKASKGWAFTFRGDFENGVVDYTTWLVRARALLNVGYALVNEGGTELPLEDLLALVETKRKEAVNYDNKSTESTQEWFDADGNSFSNREFC